ncbi:type IV pilin N-terminal domain-containing protein [Halosegnis marinus]|uniref:Type IV pilin N-terminal domain-containing protein n=1 Tax=Halosegnis marinus TaxID=3034023 RepID=A0ABD5ZMU0_9EURY|nr:type IV pilin N-terminal domain-containing protein [Halosegnis sp. DT85]
MATNGERGAAPATAVVYTVAITLIVGSIAGAYVFGLGPDSARAAPAVSYDASHGGSELAVVHDGGATLDGERTLRLEVWVLDEESDARAEFVWLDATGPALAEFPLAHTDTLTLYENEADGGSDYELPAGFDLSRGDTVRVVWYPRGENSSHVVGEDTLVR